MKHRTLLVVMVFLFLSGCVRSSSHSSGGIPAPVNPASPTLAIKVQQQTSAGSLPNNMVPTKSTTQAISSTVLETVTLLAPTAMATDAEQSLQTLMVFPLEVGNSWVFDYQGYSGNEKASWQVVDTIVDSIRSGGSYAAKIDHEVSLIQGAPGKDFLNPPQEGIFWYVVAGASIYRQDELDWSTVAKSWQEFVWPFPERGCWFPDGSQREAVPDPGAPGCRQADGPADIQTPAGSLSNCYHLVTPYNNGPVILDFCEQIGIVGGEFSHVGTPFGYQFILTAYSLQNK